MNGYEVFVKEDLLFHLELAEIAKNDILKHVIVTLREMMSGFIEGVSRSSGTAEQAVDYHKRIF